MSERKKSVSKKTKIMLILIGLVLFSSIFFSLTGLAMYSLSSYSNYSQPVQGSYYSVTANWLELGVNSNNQTLVMQNTLESDLDPILDADGPGGGAEIQASVGRVFRSNSTGSVIDKDTVPEIIMTRVVNDTLYTFELYHFSLDLVLKTQADVNVTDDPLHVHLVDNNKEWGGVKVARSLPRKNVEIETDPVDVNLKVLLQLTPFTIGSQTVYSEDGSVQYKYEDLWMGILGASLTMVPEAGDVGMTERYSNDPTNLKGAFSDSYYIGDTYGWTPVPPNSYDHIQASSLNEIDYSLGLDTNFYDPYSITLDTIGKSLSLYELGGGAYNRIFTPSLQLTDAPGQGYVSLHARLQAGSEYFRDWYTYNYYTYYPIGYWNGIPAETYICTTAGKTVNYLVGGRAINVYVTYRVTFDVAAVGTYSFQDWNYIPDYIRLEVPPELRPKVNVAGYGEENTDTYTGTGNILLDSIASFWRNVGAFFDELFTGGGLWSIFIPIIVLILVFAAAVVLIKLPWGKIGGRH